MNCVRCDDQPALLCNACARAHVPEPPSRIDQLVTLLYCVGHNDEAAMAVQDGTADAWCMRVFGINASLTLESSQRLLRGMARMRSQLQAVPA